MAVVTIFRLTAIKAGQRRIDSGWTDNVLVIEALNRSYRKQGFSVSIRSREVV